MGGYNPLDILNLIRDLDEGKGMKKAVFLSVLVVVLIMAMPIAMASPIRGVHVFTDNGRKYCVGHGDCSRYVSFWYVAGDRITWRMGGAKFVYYENASAQKVQTLMMDLMEMFKDLGFITMAGTVKPTKAYIVYVYDGILEFEDLWFIDDDGRIIIEWSEGNPLNITIYAKATVLKSESHIDSYGLGDREAIIDISKLPYQILTVPREGIIYEDEVFGHKVYLGGGAKLNVINQVGTMLVGGKAIVRNGVVVGFQNLRYEPYVDLKAYQSFWHREPIHIYVYKNGNVEHWVKDLRYGHEYMLSS